MPFAFVGLIIGYMKSRIYDDGFDYKRSYMCNSSNTMSLLMDTKKDTNSTYFSMNLIIKDFRVQAFQFDNSNGFGNGKYT